MPNFMGLDIKNFYINTPMDRYEYMIPPIEIIPQEIINEYQLMNKVKMASSCVNLMRNVRTLPGGNDCKKILTEKLSRHRYHHSELIPGLSKHYKNSVKFA